MTAGEAGKLLRAADFPFKSAKAAADVIAVRTACKFSFFGVVIFEDLSGVLQEFDAHRVRHNIALKCSLMDAIGRRRSGSYGLGWGNERKACFGVGDFP
jgi:hypothetical protein